ncbi:MAG: hypothetical protein M0Z36_01425 [Thermaerobacter sp.]|nr:hypothetical protein [Thermaerobacter sp.]
MTNGVSQNTSEAVAGDVAHHIDFWTVRQFFTATLSWEPPSTAEPGRLVD